MSLPRLWWFTRPPNQTKARPIEGVPINAFTSSQAQEPLPKDREGVLEIVGQHKAKIYHTVRRILNAMEEAAPWDMLYYPPADTRTFLKMEAAFLQVVDGIPKLIQTLTDSLEQSAAASEEAEHLLGEAEFFFAGIHENVAFDIGKLRDKVKSLSVTASSIALTAEERAFTCEVTADLKGKYSSSIMGAASAIIADGRWNGVAIEPILFPEKEEEFERNELLVKTLSEVVKNIAGLLEDLPLAELVEQWQRDERVDQYALTSLYSFLGNLGKLMKGKCRRALYSGDYHQIQRRESLLSTRINELTTLHNVTWNIVPAEVVPGGDDPFPNMHQKATELAAILDLNILRKIVGEKVVKDLLHVVTIERERRKGPTPEGEEEEPDQKSSLRKSIPQHLHTLIPLLYDEDLQNFLSLLLGSVAKRASLAITRQRQADEEARKANEEARKVDEAKRQAVAEAMAAAEAARSAPAVDETPSGGMAQAELDALEAAAAEAARLASGSEVEMPEVMQLEELQIEELEIETFDDEPSTEDLPVAPPQSPQPSSPLDSEAPTFGALTDEAPSFGEVELASAPFGDGPSFDGPSFDSGPSFDGPSFDSGPGFNSDPSFDSSSDFAPSPPSPAFDTDDAFPVDSSAEVLDMPDLGSMDWGESSDADDPFAAFEAAAELADAAIVEPEAPSGMPAGEKMRLLRSLAEILDPLQSRTNAHRKSFELVHRLLRQKKTVPPAMLESMHPYIFDVMNTLIPQLHQASEVPEISTDHISHLIEYCTFLCNKKLSPEQLKDSVPATMDRLLKLLNGLTSITHSTLRELDPLA